MFSCTLIDHLCRRGARRFRIRTWRKLKVWKLAGILGASALVLVERLCACVCNSRFNISEGSPFRCSNHHSARKQGSAIDVHVLYYSWIADPAFHCFFFTFLKESLEDFSGLRILEESLNRERLDESEHADAKKRKHFNRCRAPSYLLA